MPFTILKGRPAPFNIPHDAPLIPLFKAPTPEEIASKFDVAKFNVQDPFLYCNSDKCNELLDKAMAELRSRIEQDGEAQWHKVVGSDHMFDVRASDVIACDPSMPHLISAVRRFRDDT